MDNKSNRSKYGKNTFSTILKAGLIVGTLDILSAFVYYFIKTGGGNPLNVLKFVASGVFGKKAFPGGSLIVLSGLVFHYFIALSFTFFFFWLYPKLKLLSFNTVLTGILYGMFIWFVMNIIVVPLSNIPSRPFDLVNSLINVSILIICIGIPLSYMANRAYKRTYTVG